MAVIIAELEKRGEDLSHLRIGLLPTLRLIATGRLLPGIVVLYAGQPGILKKIAGRPREEQERIIAQGSVWESAKEPREAPLVVPREYVKPERPEHSSAPNLKSLAQNGSTKDIADMMIEMLRFSERPEGIFKELLLRMRALPMAAEAKRAVNAALISLGGTS